MRGIRLGAHVLEAPVVFLAPMAGVSDLPFRQLCKSFGASATVTEMLASDIRLWTTSKSRHRLSHRLEPGPRIVQLVGNDPVDLANAARANVAAGAEVIDLNLGCPAKKVCKRAAGSALLGEPDRVRILIRSLVAAVSVPITVKIRLGLNRESINAPDIARIAQDEGVAMLTVHGRTRACGFRGQSDTVAISRVVAAVEIPVIANGDIDSPEKAAQVLAETGAAGVMIGRAAQGKPWLPGQIRAALAGRKIPTTPQGETLGRLVLTHIEDLHRHYGEEMGVRIARKHIGWYLAGIESGERRRILELDGASAQLAQVERCFQAY
jgi:tRNA-dihydrouridine synthase B